MSRERASTRVAAARRVAYVAAACLVLGAVSLLIPSGPSYDPWTWIIWGREVAAGDLRTSGGISWKPLPVLFTAPFSLFGDIAPDLWLVVARATAFGAVTVAALLGYRMAGRLGAVFAGGFLLTAHWFWTPVLLGNSEGALVLFVLGAVERHTAGREAQSFALWLLAALVRAEAWPFLALYALWLLVRQPGRVAWLAPGLAIVPALWLLPELWGSGELWRGAERAQQHLREGSPGLADRPALAVVERAGALTQVSVFLGLAVGGIAVALGAAPGRRLAWWLAALGAVWLGVVAVMSELGFSGNDRYLVLSLAIAAVLGGTGLAWAINALLATARRRSASALAATCLAGRALVGVVRAIYLGWPSMIDAAGRHQALLHDLPRAIERAGGEQRLEGCGALYASDLVTPMVAWVFERHLEEVTAYGRAPGVVLRGRLVRDLPLDPPRGALGDIRTRTILARTRYWEVEAACRDRQGRGSGQLGTPPA